MSEDANVWDVGEIARRRCEAFWKGLRLDDDNKIAQAVSEQQLPRTDLRPRHSTYCKTCVGYRVSDGDNISFFAISWIGRTWFGRYISALYDRWMEFCASLLQKRSTPRGSVEVTPCIDLQVDQTTDRISGVVCTTRCHRPLDQIKIFLELQ